MKAKTSKIITICLSVIAIGLLIALLALILNPIKYYEFEEDGYTFIYKGSFGKARRVIIKNDGEKISTINIKSDADIFDSIEEFKAIVADIDGDAEDDILIPTAHDEEDDVIYSVFLFDGEEFAAYEGAAVANPMLDESGIIYTEETIKIVIEEETKISPEIYERTEKIAKHAFDADGKLITLEERAIIYYSESDYYCYSIYEYNEEAKDLVYVDEIWFDPIKLDQYPLTWD